jgi:hypothetical protein
MGRILCVCLWRQPTLCFLSASCMRSVCGNWVVPKSIDSGETGPVGTAILINGLLLGFRGTAQRHGPQGFKR